MPHITITCPFCTQRNDIHAANVPGVVSIACSHCHNRLGTWTDLAKGPPLSARAPEKPGSDPWWLDRLPS